jgi:hypothetical protein
VKVDLYVFDGKEVILYEAKKDEADVQALYQILMYWDGAVSDGRHPSEGIVLASSFSPGVEPLLKEFNQRKDANGTPYNFVLKTWESEDIPYPK